MIEAAQAWHQARREYYEPDKYTRSPLTPEEERMVDTSEFYLPYLHRLSKRECSLIAAIDALRASGTRP